MMEEMFKCNRCGQILPASSYKYIHGNRITICKNCMKKSKKVKISELRETINNLKEELKVQKERNKSLVNRLEKLENKNKKLTDEMSAKISQLKENNIKISKENTKLSHDNKRMLNDLKGIEPAYDFSHRIIKCKDCGKVFLISTNGPAPLRCKDCAKQYHRKTSKENYDGEKCKERNKELPDCIIKGHLKQKGFNNDQITPDLVELERNLIVFRRQIRDKQKQEGTFYLNKQKKHETSKRKIIITPSV